MERALPYEATGQQWVEVLVDCPGIQGLYTYGVPQGLSVQVGDIVSVPFGSQLMGGIAVNLRQDLPENLVPGQIKAIEEVITQSFFAPTYWQLLDRVATSYGTELMSVIRLALPPGLLERSQRRIRLKADALPPGYEVFCSPLAQRIIQLLKGQKAGNYSYVHLQRQIPGVQRGIRELTQRGWIESYLEDPKTIQVKHQKAVTLLTSPTDSELTAKQREVLEVLRRHGGELWFSTLQKLTHSSGSVIESLAKKGYLAIQPQERLRLLSQGEVIRDQAKPLTPDQSKALARLNQVSGYAQVLLHGVTGSGKTEVYLQAIAPLLTAGKSVLVLVPEIGLTPQLTDRFRARFGNKICVYHSALSDGERYDTWRQMLSGTTQIVIGTRSAIFSPLPNLGLIILDEEHDSSFKQSQLMPAYHARTVAQWRAELENCPLILGSATPSLETWVNIHSTSQAQKVPSHYLSLPERVRSRPLPPVEIVDMRQELKASNYSIFSRSLQKNLGELKAQGKQGILFISRRGHSTFVSCRSCGYVMECPHCDVSLSYHYTHEGASELLRCHYCNFSQRQPKVCPSCQSPYLKFFGSGTQKVTEALSKQFPELKWLRFDSDTTRTKGAHRQIVEQFSQGKADILVGTQMLTKGLDIEQVTLVGVIAADSLLNFSDYRSGERAFQTLTQVAGRAGRGEDSGKVIIQTYTPQHPVIQAVQDHDYLTFVEQELPQREALNYPPYGRLILIRLSGLESEIVEKTAIAIAEECQILLGEQAEILGPTPASIMRVARRFRWHILLKFPDRLAEIPDLKKLKAICPTSVSFSLDVDPLYIE
ncbi:MAG: primosomal protein N' [Snowella sp.]|nr:primosomal protein N' [Snowella sp.]